MSRRPRLLAGVYKCLILACDGVREFRLAITFPAHVGLIAADVAKAVGNQHVIFANKAQPNRWQPTSVADGHAHRRTARQAREQREFLRTDDTRQSGTTQRREVTKPVQHQVDWMLGMVE